MSKEMNNARAYAKRWIDVYCLHHDGFETVLKMALHKYEIDSMEPLLKTMCAYVAKYYHDAPIYRNMMNYFG